MTTAKTCTLYAPICPIFSQLLDVRESFPDTATSGLCSLRHACARRPRHEIVANFDVTRHHPNSRCTVPLSIPGRTEESSKPSIPALCSPFPSTPPRAVLALTAGGALRKIRYGQFHLRDDLCGLLSSGHNSRGRVIQSIRRLRRNRKPAAGARPGKRAFCFVPISTA